ncbi:MAG: prepilin-type N-terminal cleavage/methylation domain-containing protein [Syntrophobacteraceae bacterium]
MAAPLRVYVSACPRVGQCRRGFTLLEMLVGLALATLMIGAMLGLISESLRYKVNLKDKAQTRPILESAAQIILADPVKAMQGFIRLDEFDGSPMVGVNLLPVQLGDTGLGEKSGQLYRVMLSYKSGILEFSIIVPSDEQKSGGL